MSFIAWFLADRWNRIAKVSYCHHALSDIVCDTSVLWQSGLSQNRAVSGGKELGVSTFSLVRSTMKFEGIPSIGVQSRVGLFLTFRHYISETGRAGHKQSPITNHQFSTCAKVDDLEWPWMVKMHVQSAITKKVVYYRLQRSAHISSTNLLVLVYNFAAQFHKKTLQHTFQ